jgi:hypothetical protein
MLYEYGSFCRRIKNFCFFITSRSYNVAFLKRYRFFTFNIDFARKPRSLSELDRWKATEFRMFLLYIGPVILKQYLEKSKFKNFLCFSVAASILLSETRVEMIEYARKLLVCFVQQSEKLYGKYICCVQRSQSYSRG